MPTDPRRPNLFLVGAQKSGTTTLAVMLASHPQVFMSTPKEPGFLAFGEAGYTALDGHGRLPRASSWVVRSQRDYLDLFRHAPPRAQVLGEASTWYLSEPGCAERLRAFNPEARLLLILRHPADRAYSAWCDARRSGEEPCEDFVEALALEQQREAPSHLLRYREMGRYARYLEHYLEVFGRGNVLVLFYEDLCDRPEWLWQECCDFLDLPAVPAPTAYRQNRSGIPRSRLLQRLMRSEALKRRFKALLPLPFLASIKSLLDGWNLQRFPALEPALREQLCEEFSGEIRELQAVTGRDLRHWLPESQRHRD